jgi:Ca2+-binding EF-hand superfamily protein
MNKITYTGLLITLMTLLPINAQSTSIPFAVYDKDADGLISEKEFIETRTIRMSKMATKGRTMKGASTAPTFSEFDTNKNGTLTQDELSAGQKSQMEKRRGMNKGMGMNMPSFSDYDLDGNGKILEKEFDEARNKRISERVKQGYQMKNIGNAASFSDIDSNGDGQISKEEFTAHQSQQRQQRIK